MKVTFDIRPLQAGDDLRPGDESIGEYVDETGTWTDTKGKGRDYALDLDVDSQNTLLDLLSVLASQSSGKNQVVTFKGGKTPKLTLTQSKKGSLAFSLEAKVRAENDKGKVKKGAFRMKGSGQVD